MGEAMNETSLATLTREQLGEIVKQLPVEQRAGFSKAANAASKHLRDSKKNYAKAFDLCCAVVENWWRLGAEIPRLGIRPGQPKKNPEKSQNTLSSLGISEKQSSYAQKLAEKSKSELDEWLEGIRDETRYKLPSLFGAATHVANNSGENEWYTPPEYLEAACKTMGGIDLDPATSELAQSRVKAGTFYTAADNGLEKPWFGNVWLNPPYSKELIGEFTERAAEAFDAGEVKQACVLVNNATDTAWYQRLARSASAICFIAGRIKFHDKNGDPKNTPLQGQSVLYLGKRAKSFEKAFFPFGFIVEATP